MQEETETKTTQRQSKQRHKQRKQRLQHLPVHLSSWWCLYFRCLTASADDVYLAGVCTHTAAVGVGFRGVCTPQLLLHTFKVYIHLSCWCIFLGCLYTSRDDADLWGVCTPQLMVYIYIYIFEVSVHLSWWSWWRRLRRQSSLLLSEQSADPAREEEGAAAPLQLRVGLLA